MQRSTRKTRITTESMGCEGHLEGHLHGDVPVEEAERARRADDVDAGGGRILDHLSGPIASSRSRGTGPAWGTRPSARSRGRRASTIATSAPATGRCWASSDGMRAALKTPDQGARAVGIDRERCRRHQRAAPSPSDSERRTVRSTPASGRRLPGDEAIGLARRPGARCRRPPAGRRRRSAWSDAARARGARPACEAAAGAARVARAGPRLRPSGWRAPPGPRPASRAGPRRRASSDAGYCRRICWLR